MVPNDPYEATQSFNVGGKGKSPFGTAGAMSDFHVVTCDVAEDFCGERRTLGDVIVPPKEVPESFYIPEEKLERWRYLKGSKSEERVNKQTGFKYHYSEGSMAFPDLLSNPARGHPASSILWKSVGVIVALFQTNSTSCRAFRGAGQMLA